jgi:cell division septal protein FtsQ
MNKTRKRIQERQRKKRQRNTLIVTITGGLLLIVSGFFIVRNALENKADPSLIEVSGQPSLKVDQELIDYGDVKLNTNLTFVLNLTNVGDQSLEISEDPYVEVREGC